MAVVLYEGRVLVGPRTGEQALAGYWEFPGGRIARGETPEAAVLRECLEETGIAVRVEGPLATVCHDYAHASVELHFFSASPVGEPADPRPPFRWVAVQSLSTMPFPPANSSIVRWLQEPPDSDQTSR